MKIIIDCGATRSKLRLLDGKGIISDTSGRGINLSTMSLQTVTAALDELLAGSRHLKESVSEIGFYAAGIASSETESAIKVFLNSIFPAASIEIGNDMLAAARAVCGNTPGIAAILGTGSNSCLFDGNTIVRQVRSGGFILGDEGSAARLGRIFISDYIKGLVPPELVEAFDERFAISGYEEIIENVYRSKNSPSGYLGSFAPFIIENYEHPYMQGITDANFNDFFTRVLSQYSDADKYETGLVGGFAYSCETIIRRIAQEHGIRIGKILDSPMDGLTLYHQNG